MSQHKGNSGEEIRKEVWQRYNNRADLLKERIYAAEKRCRELGRPDDIENVLNAADLAAASLFRTITVFKEHSADEKPLTTQMWEQTHEHVAHLVSVAEHALENFVPDPSV